MAFEDDAQINDSMDASMVDMPTEADERLDTESSFRERLGKDGTTPLEESEREHPSM